MTKADKSVKTAGKAAIVKPAAAKPSLRAIKGGKPIAKAAAKPVPLKAASPAAVSRPRLSSSCSVGPHRGQAIGCA